MKLSYLSEIVRNVRARLTCPKCQACYNENMLEVVDIIGNKGIFAAQCIRCNTSTLVTLNTREFKQKITTREKQIAKVQFSKVAPDDVIDIKNFLENFDGDFSKSLTLVEKSELIPKENDITKNE